MSPGKYTQSLQMRPCIDLSGNLRITSTKNSTEPRPSAITKPELATADIIAIQTFSHRFSSFPKSSRQNRVARNCIVQRTKTNTGLGKISRKLASNGNRTDPRKATSGQPRIARPRQSLSARTQTPRIHTISEGRGKTRASMSASFRLRGG